MMLFRDRRNANYASDSRALDQQPHTMVIQSLEFVQPNNQILGREFLNFCAQNKTMNHLTREQLNSTEF